jgi:hypothetical protein
MDLELFHRFRRQSLSELHVVTMTKEDYKSTRDVLFSSDDRYDVWEVKRFERLHLIQLDNDQDVGSGDDDDDAESSTSVVDLPLIDGCDLKGWRHSKLIKISS